MRPLPFILVLVLLGSLAVSPVHAEDLTGFILNPWDFLKQEKISYEDVYNVTFDAAKTGDAINLIHFKVPAEQTVYFTIYTYKETLSGSATAYFNLSIIPPTTTTSSITFDGVTKSYNFLDTNPEWDWFLSGYAVNKTSNEDGIIVYHAGYGMLDDSLAIFHVVPGEISQNLIWKVDISCNVPIDLEISYSETSAVAAAADKTAWDAAWEWINFAIGLGGLVLGIVQSAISWMKFFFVDNLLMTVALYLSISMAFAAGKSRSIDQFFRKFISDQRKFYAFIVDLWNLLISIISAFRSIFRL